MFQGDKEAKEQYVKKMFDSIAGRYDLMNLVITAGLWSHWRRVFLRSLGLRPGQKVLDVCCGTGDQSLAMAAQVTPGGTVTGIDFSREMLAVGTKKVGLRGFQNEVELRWGNALDLPFPDAQFDLATICFALRNVSDIPRVLREMARVVKPGGRVVSLEISRPENPFFRVPFFLYFYWVVPLIGWLVGSRSVKGETIKPYTYLPHSLSSFPGKQALANMFREAGLADVSYRSLSGGCVAIHTGVKPSL